MHDAEDEPLFVERVAGLDIGKAEVEVTIRVPSDTHPGRRQQETRTFGTTRRQLLDLAGWLRCWGVTKTGMEATGLLEGPLLPAGSRGLRLRPVQRRSGQGAAGQAENGSGRLDLARQDRRAGHDLLQLRAPRAGPQAAHPHPLPASPHPGPHGRETASGKNCWKTGT